MNPTPSKPTRYLPIKGWLIILPTLVILALAVLLTGTTSAAPTSGGQRELSSRLTLQQQQPVCESCHPDEYKAWKDSTHAKATLDPVFQEQLSKSHNQGECLKCHTTGFDTGSGKFMSEGVTCEACHGQYKEGHPAGETMSLPIDTSTCRMCHEAAFKGWEQSKHAEQKIECFDCHQAHTQGLRTGSAETLCAACHSDEKTTLSHSIHGISGVDCSSCHMAKETTATASVSGAEVSASSHTFTVPADVCNRCHSDATHPAASAQIRTSQTPAGGAIDTSRLQQSDRRVKELEDQVTEAQGQIDSLRSIGVIGMGLALGGGGVVGLLIGIAGMSLWHARKAK